MPPIERDAPRDLNKTLRHQHSASSDHGRALVPMWDSSDPERAPPPLPLNPQSPGVVSRAGTSSAIQSAHAALTEKARENNALVPHIPHNGKRIDTSPERPLFRESTHRRMQSLQTTLQTASVKDMSLMLESGRESPIVRSPEKMERPSTPPSRRDTFDEHKENREHREHREDRDEKAVMNSLRPGPSLTPIIRPVVRRSHQSILGENTPPQSATMLALQNMSNQNATTNTPTPKEPEAPLANITNGSSALVKVPGSLDALSNQILTLTNIATTLQKEMSQLSRRSRDNATDLLSLKEATNARDEDIRKSLREIIIDAKSKMQSRDPYGGPLLLEGRHYPSSPTSSTMSKSVRPFSLPRIPSPNSFSASLDRDSMLSSNTPSLMSDSSPATVALLEKVYRDMGTREGQDTMLHRLTEIADRLNGIAGADKVEELIRLVKSNQQHAVVPAVGGAGGGGIGGGGSHDRDWSFDEDDDGTHQRELNFNQGGHVGRLLQDQEARRSSASSKAADVLNDDVLKAIRTIKDSVAQGGGLTAEVKALVRELRGEVLGMGREIGRRLDEIAVKGDAKADTGNKTEMTKVIEEGLAEMQQQMNNLLREHRRQSSATAASRESSIDYKEIYNSMRAALKDSQANKPRGAEIRREEVLQAVKDAWERYQPDITVQQIGLERSEILACLQEGLHEYAPRDDRPPGATREEVFKAVVEGLKHWVPPQVETPATMSRDEILDAVRECLEEFEFPVVPSAGPEISKDDMLDAVKEGLHGFDFPTPQPAPSGSDVTRDDMLDAVNEGLHSFDFSGIQSSALVSQSLSKGDVTDAIKQGLETLDLSTHMIDIVREGVESLDLPRDMAEAVKKGLDSFDFSSINSSALVPASDASKADVANAVKEALGSLDLSDDVSLAVHNALHTFDFASIIPRVDITRVDVSDAVKEGFESLDLSEGVARAVKEGLQSMDLSSGQSSALVPLSSNNDDIVQRLREIKESLRAEFEAVSEEAKQNIAASGRDTEQVLDATKDGLERLRQDIESYVDRARGETDQQEFMSHLDNTLDGFRQEVGQLVAKSSDSSKEVIREEIESLRDAVNSSLVPALPQQGTGSNKEILEALHDGLGSLRSEISTRPIAGLTEILDALQEGLGDIRSSIDKLHNKPTDLTANDEILDALKNGLDGVRSEIDDLREESKNDRALAPIGDNSESNVNVNAMIAAEYVVKQDDIKNLEVLITQLSIKVEAMESTPPPVIESLSKEDLARMEDMLQSVAAAVAEMPIRQPLEPLEEMLHKVQQSVDEMATRDSTSAAAAAPATSSGDAATREDVEAIETILRNTKSRLDDLVDGEQAVRKDHVDTIETLILETRESLDGLFTHLEHVACKEDITMVGSLVTQIIGSFDEMKERHEKTLEDPEKVTKTDIDAIEAVCLDMKQDIAQMVRADIDSHSSKEDIQGLELLLKDFRDRLESVAESHTKQFEERQAETVGVGERVIEVKTFLEEFQDIVKGKLEDGAKGIDALNGLLDSMGDTIRKNSNITDDLKEMFDTIKLEFEESRAGVVGAKLEADEKFQFTTDTITSRLDERISDLILKYDEFYLAQEDRAIKGEARDAELEASFISTKAVAEELKSLVDTLGTAVTDSLEKMEEASRTVFDRVEELVNKSEEHHTDGKIEHQITRDNIQEAIGKVDGIQGHVAEYQPKIFEAIQEVLSIVGQHFDHSKTSTETIQEKIEEAKPPMLPPPEKYDDEPVIERLDKLIDHTQVADKAFAQFDTLDKVHAQVKQTAAELAVFIATQTQRIADEHEDRERSLQETIVNLERRLAEKEQIEANLASLKEEESRLRETINVTLREEQEQIKHHFLINLQEEEMRLKDITNSIKEEQEQLRETFISSVKEEQSRIMEMNVGLKEEQELLKETFLANLREEESRLKEMNDALREEQHLLKATFLNNLREEESLLKEVNSGLREEQQQLRDSFLASFKEEEQRLNEVNTALREEQEQMRASFKEEQERFRADLLANLLEEESRLKDNNDSLRAEQQLMKEEFFAGLKQEEDRLKTGLHEMRTEQNSLGRQKTRLAADLSSLDTALRLRREELHDMEARAEGLERRILEGVMDHSRVLLMAKNKRASGRESMSRKRVSSQTHQSPESAPINLTTVDNPKPRNALNMALSAKSKALSPNTPGGASRRILSLSQITNNVAAGGIKRSQSVRTAVAPGRLRKTSWAAGGNRPPAAKGYGDLDDDRDKENIDLEESEEEHNVEFNDAYESQPPVLPPVDIIVSAPSSIADSESEVGHSDEHGHEMIPEDSHGGEGEEEDSGAETETLRRSSLGTTVITGTESYTGSEGYSDGDYEDGDETDARSDWTESVAGDRDRDGAEGSVSEFGSEVSESVDGDEGYDHESNQGQLVLASSGQ